MNNLQEHPEDAFPDPDDLLLAGKGDELFGLRDALRSRESVAITGPIGHGKTTLALKAAFYVDRPAVVLRLQFVTSLLQISERLIAALFEIKPQEEIEDGIKRLSEQPEITREKNGFKVYFPEWLDGLSVLEEVLALADDLADPARPLIIVWEEFPDILNLGLKPSGPAAERLAATLRRLELVDSLFLGSREPQMQALFESADSEFFDLATSISFGRSKEIYFGLPVYETLKAVLDKKTANDNASHLAKIAEGNPACTRDLVRSFLIQCKLHGDKASVEAAADELVRQRHAVYSTLWKMLGRVPRRVLCGLAQDEPPQGIFDFPASTINSAARKLKAEGLIFQDERSKAYRIMDPLFARWIRQETAKASFGYKADLELLPGA